MSTRRRPDLKMRRRMKLSVDERLSFAFRSNDKVILTPMYIFVLFATRDSCLMPKYLTEYNNGNILSWTNKWQSTNSLCTRKSTEHHLILLLHGQFDFTQTSIGFDFRFDWTILHRMSLITWRIASWTLVGAKDRTKRDQFFVVPKSMRRIDFVSFAIRFTKCTFDVFATVFSTPTSLGN